MHVKHYIVRNSKEYPTFTFSRYYHLFVGWVYQPRPNKRRRRRQSPATGHAAHQTCNQLLLVLPDGKQIICPAIPVPSNGQQGGVAENGMIYVIITNSKDNNKVTIIDVVKSYKCSKIKNLTS